MKNLKYHIFYWSIILGISPIGYLIWAVYIGQYSAESSKEILRFLGDISIYFLLGVLGIQFIARLIFKNKSIWNYLSLLAKIFGLYAFFYALVHIIFYIFIEQGGDIFMSLQETWRRIYLLLGAVAFLLMTFLGIFSIGAIFSSKSHRVFGYFSSFAYLAGLLASIHYLLGQKIAVLSSYLIFLLFFILLCAKLLSKSKDRR